MTAPVPEERNDAYDLKPGEVPPGEHDGELPDGADARADGDGSSQEENAESSLDQPSQ